MKTPVLVVSCEHAGNRVPDMFSTYFEGANATLDSHRGWDPGAIEIAKGIAVYFSVDVFHYDYTRLLIEPNRSVGHPQLFSEFTMRLSEEDKSYLLETYYRPYRNKVKQVIKEQIELGHRVVHLSIHSFTPVWEGKERQVDIGLLFDEGRLEELAFCEKWKKAMFAFSPSYNIRFNEPYLGKDDGFTTSLRQCLDEMYYLGVEVEVNQKFNNSAQLVEVSHFLCSSLDKSPCLS